MPGHSYDKLFALDDWRRWNCYRSCRTRRRGNRPGRHTYCFSSSVNGEAHNGWVDSDDYPPEYAEVPDDGCTTFNDDLSLSNITGDTGIQGR